MPDRGRDVAGRSGVEDTPPLVPRDETRAASSTREEDGPVSSPLETLDEPAELSGPGDARRGEAFGRYVLLECIGRGGMGLVYSAYDPQLDRRIALKLLRRAQAPDPRARARMLREAQAIARVRHPNVITVHDAGVLDERVFIAMELVSGKDLRQWLSEGPRDHRVVLDIMKRAGRGLAAAHRAGLVHRDFKPGNVLIGDDGHVRVADFGLARPVAALHGTNASRPSPSEGGDRNDVDSSTSDTTPGGGSTPSIDESLTRTGARLGTPAYMAPEQHAGTGIDARSDQFAYCVALYEALWGKRPFSGSNPIDLMMRISEGKLDPPPRGSPVPLRIQQAVLRGLAPRPEDRWADMDALLVELDRADRRSRVRWGLGLTGFAGAAVAIAATVWPANRDQLCLTEHPLGAAWTQGDPQAIRDAFERTGTPYATQSHTSVVEALDAWSEDWTRARTDACEATRIRGEQSEALLDLRIACYDRQRRTASTLVEQLAVADEKVVEGAVESVTRIESPVRCDAANVLARAPLPDDPVQRAAVVKVADRIDTLRGLWAVGRYEEGLSQAELAAQEAEAAGHAPVLAEALVQLGVFRDGAGHKRESIEALHRAARTAIAAGDDVILADAWVHLVWSAAQAMRAEEALVWAEYAEVAIDRLDRPAGLVAELRSAQGSALWSAGRNEEALARIDEALHLREQMDPNASVVSTLLVQSANALIPLRRLDEAQARLERARAIAEAAQGQSHPNLGPIHNTLGVVAYQRGGLERALASFERSYAIQERALGDEHPDVLFSLGNIGNVRRELGRHDEALEVMERVLVLARRAYGDVHRETATTLHNIASIHQSKGDHERALMLFEEVLPLREQVHGPDHTHVANTLTSIGEVLVELERADEAIPPLERALRIRDEADHDPKARARTRFALARAVQAASTDTPAEPLAQAALVELQSLSGDAVAERQRQEIEQWLAAREL